MKKTCVVCCREFLDSSPNASRKTCGKDCMRLHNRKRDLASNRLWRAQQQAWRDQREGHKVKL